ncbi:MAG: tyrosine-type recombinase/integrase [Blastocatellia bacterium]|nr:tyrosine-type recombinase/integrase [Blastocatellia bacterium]
MNRAVDAYLAELEARRFSHSRRTSSARTLERLLLYLREAHQVTDWRAVNETHLRDFAVYAATRHRSPRGKLISAATLRQWFSIIRSFFVWMNRNGHLLHNPAERLAFPRKEQPLPHVLNESDIARLIETPDATTALGLRDRALMETLYATGIRHAEAHKLDLYDIDTAAHRLTVRLGKGQRDRLVPLTETAAHWLRRYVTVARPELAAGKWWGKGRRRGQPKLIPPTSAIWLSVTGRRLCYGCIADRIRDYASQAELKATVHTFRHCCATHLLRGGASVRHVQQLLGHRDLNTTEIYTHIELQDLQQAIQYHSAPPKNSLAVKGDSQIFPL